MDPPFARIKYGLVMKILCSFIDREPFPSVAILLQTGDYFKSCTFQFELKFMSSNGQQQKPPKRSRFVFSFDPFRDAQKRHDRKEKGFAREREKKLGSERRLGYQPINQANRSRLRLLLRSPLLGGSHQATNQASGGKIAWDSPTISSFRKDPPTCE